MNSLESGSNVQSGLEMIMEKSPDTIVLVDRNLTLVKVISAKDDYYHYLANNCIGKQPQALFPDGKNYDQYEIYRAAVKRVFEEQVKVDFSLEDMDLTELRGKATYAQVKEYILNEFGLKVSSLYIAQVKKKCGLEVGENFNLPKSEGTRGPVDLSSARTGAVAETTRQPQVTPEKEEAIMKAFRHFGVIE